MVFEYQKAIMGKGESICCALTKKKKRERARARYRWAETAPKENWLNTAFFWHSRMKISKSSKFPHRTMSGRDSCIEYELKISPIEPCNSGTLEAGHTGASLGKKGRQKPAP